MRQQHGSYPVIHRRVALSVTSTDVMSHTEVRSQELVCRRITETTTHVEDKRFIDLDHTEGFSKNALTYGQEDAFEDTDRVFSLSNCVSPPPGAGDTVRTLHY